MKINVIFALLSLLISTISYSQHTWVPKGSYVTYGTPGKGIWHIGANEDDPKETMMRLDGKLSELYSKQIHPFDWNKSVPEEVMWHIHGSKEALNKELQGVDLKNPPSWIWETAPNKPIGIQINLAGNGFGRVNVYQSDQIIASFRCVSSEKVSVGKETIKHSQPRPGPYKVFSKELVHPSKEFGLLPMKWALGIDAKRGIYLHSRNISENSHGCIGMCVPAARWLYSRAQYGTKVSIIPLE